LDSTAATNLVETLRSLADSGKTIIAVIHQPSQHVFTAFDDLLLVSEGKQMYFGEVANIRSYMAEHAYEAAAEMGTAEHILDCISKAQLPNETVEDAADRMHRLAEVAKATPIDVGKTSDEIQKFAGSRGGPRANILIQFKLLCKRALRETFRGKTQLIIKLVQQVTLGLIYGGIYSIGNNQVRDMERPTVFLNVEESNIVAHAPDDETIQFSLPSKIDLVSCG
jgi:hypothetical protein